MTNRRPGSVLLFVLVLSGIVFSLFEPVEAQVDAAALSRAMKSIAVLTAETKDGKESRGLAFLMAGEGRAVTAAHLLKNASRVTLRFQDGAESLSPGIIAVDEKRGLAMIEVPASGRQGLTLVQTSISPGTMVHCGAVRDGTYGFVQLSVSEIHQGASGVERYALSGEGPSGNSGSPALDQKGNVTGMVIETTEGRLLVPSVFIAAIDASSPLKSWGGEIPEMVDDPQADPGPGPMDEIDQAILDFFVILYDHDSVYRWGQETTNGKGYLQGVPEDVYHYQTKLEMAIKKLVGADTNDPLRKKIIMNLKEVGNNQVAAVNYFIQAVVTGQGAKDWGAQSQDLNKRARAAMNIAGEVLLSELPAIHELYERSTVLGEKMHRDIKYYLGIEKRVASFAIGAVTTIEKPFRLIVLYRETFGEALGLRSGDTILSAAGSRFDSEGSMEDFKAVILQNLGKTIDVVVERNGEQTTLKMKIPEEIPEKYVLPQIF
ncbi:MAG: trypsin-like peptidase domain-containing protein [Thermovirgaceae bacterium]